MITIEQAVKIYEKKFPDYRILRCYDYGDYYGFSTVPRRWNGDIGNRPTGGTIAETVNKSTGEYGYIHATDEKWPMPKKELNILPYLSEKDRKFAVKVKYDLENTDESEWIEV